MKKTIAVIGSAAALSFAGAGIAGAQSELPETGSTDAAAEAYQNEDGQNDDGETTDPETPAEVGAIAEQLCGTISAYDFLGSAGGIVPGLTGADCQENADLAVEAAMSGDISGAIDILRGIEEGTGDGDENADDTGSAAAVGSLGDAADDPADDTAGEDVADALN